MIQNGANTPLNQNPGTLPNVNGALLNWKQITIFTVVVKEVIGYQVQETLTPVTFNGVVQPFTDRQLMLKPEGQRSWTWNWIHADPSLILNTDEIVVYLDVRYRVMSRKDYTPYGYVEYSIIEDYTGESP